MSIPRRVTVRRLLAASAAALALSVAGANAAYAGDCPGGDGWDNGTPSGYKPGHGGGTKTSTDRCEFSLDGTGWYASVKVDDVTVKPGDDGKVHVKVRAAQDSASCTASLASYRTHGATWETSGKQVFHDWDTVTVKTGDTDSLDVAVPDVGCFAQMDLYYGNTKYDGDYNANDGYTHGDLPEGPGHAVIGKQKIAWWNGGTKDCTAKVIPSTSPSGSASASASTSTTPASDQSSASASQSADTSASASAVPSASTSEASAPASASASSGDLAETGSNGTGVLAAGAAVLLVAGAGVLFATRRRQAARRH